MRWNERIKRAVKRGSFTEYDKKKAGYFNTCAIGEKFKLSKNDDLSDKICFADESFNRNRKPKNKFERIHNWGMRFFNDVDFDEVEKAQNTYNRIQKLKVK